MDSHVLERGGFLFEWLIVCVAGAVSKFVSGLFIDSVMVDCSFAVDSVWVACVFSAP